ncbi:MAG TPA: MinD/ParA family protein [Planctomycetota bacterium]|jgi:flagellar biosynthesis protein FlhG|nr:MinD/ParA family protein [Planctomycetota bacterium]
MSGGEHKARALAVVSGKGGVGKTNVAVNLALALARQQRKVVLVDLDIGLANADVILGVQPRLHLGHVLAGEVSPADALCPAPCGAFLLAGAAGMRHLSDLERTERDFLVKCLKEIEQTADFVILDTAAGISRNVVQFAAAADEVLVVTTPEPTSITDGYAVIKAISREKGSGRLRLVVNLVNGPAEAARVHARIHTVARRFLGIDVGLLGSVVSDDQVRRAVRKKQPFLLDNPSAPASQCVQLLAERILGEEPAPRSTGFVKRFASALGGILS